MRKYLIITLISTISLFTFTFVAWGWTSPNGNPPAGSNSQILFSSGGNLGIGTASPTTPLTVAGIIYSTSGGIKFPDGTTQTTAFSGASTQTIVSGNVSSGAFGSNTGGGNYSFPANVGIGTTAPLAQLSIGSGSLTNGFVPIQISAPASGQSWIGINKNGAYGLLTGYMTSGGLSGNGAYIRQVTTDPLYFDVNSTVNAMTILSSGFVGIGTVSPGTNLDVQQSASSVNIRAKSTFSGGSATLLLDRGPTASGNAAQIAFITTGSNDWAMGTSQGSAGVSDYSMYNYGTASNALTILKSNNNVGIGVVSPTEKLDVRPIVYSSNQSGGIQIGTTNGYWLSGFRLKSNSTGNVRTTIDATNGGTGGTTNEVISIDPYAHVGINTTSSAISYPLTVNGTVYSMTGGFRFPDGTTQTTAFAGGSAQTIVAGNVSSGAFGSNTGGGNYSFPANVGIGTTAPLAQLSIGSGSLTNGFVPIQISAPASGQSWIGINKNGAYGLLTGYMTSGGLSGNGAYIRQVTTDPLYFDVNSTVNAMTILSSGFVGIGTVSPGTNLDVQQSASSVNIRAKSTFSGGSATLLLDRGPTASGNAAQIAFITTGSNDWAMGTSQGSAGVSDYSMYNYGTASNALTILKSNNNVGIGVVSPTEKLDVRPIVYSSNQSGGIQIGTTNGYWLSGFRLKSNSTGNVRTTIDATNGGTGGTTNEVISIDPYAHVGINTTSSAISYPLTVNGTVYSMTGGFRFPDGTTQTTAFAGGSAQTIVAGNVSSGAFGSNTGGGNYSFPGMLNVGQQGRFSGWYTAGTGLAAEIGVSNGQSYIISYNRTASSYQPLNFSGSTVSITGTTVGAGPNGNNLFINASGNVGIGTASPIATLEVAGGNGTSKIFKEISTGQPDYNYNYLKLIKIYTGTGHGATTFNGKICAERSNDAGVTTCADIYASIDYYSNIHFSENSNAVGVATAYNIFQPVSISDGTNNWIALLYDTHTGAGITSWTVDGTIYNSNSADEIGFTQTTSASAIHSPLTYTARNTSIPYGNVGIGIVNPAYKLSVGNNFGVQDEAGHVIMSDFGADNGFVFYGNSQWQHITAGLIESASGGIKFPDGTTQSTAAASSPISSVFGRTGAVVAASGDYSVAQITGAAPIASPTFTGTGKFDHLAVGAAWDGYSTMNVGGAAPNTGMGIYGYGAGGVAAKGTSYDFYGYGPTSYFAGNVGIGNTTPSAKLHVRNTAGLGFPATSGSSPDYNTEFIVQDGSTYQLHIGGNGSYGYWLQARLSTNFATNIPLLLNPNGGNVSIGSTAAPASTLSVGGAGYGSIGVYSKNAGASFYGEGGQIGGQFYGSNYGVYSNGGTTGGYFNGTTYGINVNSCAGCSVLAEMAPVTQTPTNGDIMCINPENGNTEICAEDKSSYIKGIAQKYAESIMRMGCSGTLLGDENAKNSMVLGTMNVNAVLQKPECKGWYPIALSGLSEQTNVVCKSPNGKPLGYGDILVTSSVPGHLRPIDKGEQVESYQIAGRADSICTSGKETDLIKVWIK